LESDNVNPFFAYELNIVTELFRGIYRPESARHKSWDYGSPGAYFVTICVKDRECVFGEIRDGIMGLNELGCAAARCWADIPRHFPNIELDAWIVMPNHIHGIIVIRDDRGMEATDHSPTNTVETQNLASLPMDNINNNVTQNRSTTHPRKWSPNRFGPQSMNLGSAIRGFKVGVTKYARSNDIRFQWQPRFHDRIIRNEAEWDRIRFYINQNPENWPSDRNNPNHFPIKKEAEII